MKHLPLPTTKNYLQDLEEDYPLMETLSKISYYQIYSIISSSWKLLLFIHKLNLNSEDEYCCQLPKLSTRFASRISPSCNMNLIMIWH